MTGHPITIYTICGRHYDFGGMFSSGPLDWETMMSFEDGELATNILKRLRVGETIIIPSCFFPETKYEEYKIFETTLVFKR